MSDSTAVNVNDVEALKNQVATDVAHEADRAGIYTFDPAMIALLLQLLNMGLGMWQNGTCANLLPKRSLKTECAHPRPTTKAVLVKKAKKLLKEAGKDDKKAKELVNKLLDKGAHLEDVHVVTMVGSQANFQCNDNDVQKDQHQEEQADHDAYVAHNHAEPWHRDESQTKNDVPMAELNQPSGLSFPWDTAPPVEPAREPEHNTV